MSKRTYFKENNRSNITFFTLPLRSVNIQSNIKRRPKPIDTSLLQMVDDGGPQRVMCMFCGVIAPISSHGKLAVQHQLCRAALQSSTALSASGSGPSPEVATASLGCGSSSAPSQ
eukprot:823380-Amphidinium_carterae.1